MPELKESEHYLNIGEAAIDPSAVACATIDHKAGYPRALLHGLGGVMRAIDDQRLIIPAQVDEALGAYNAHRRVPIWQARLWNGASNLHARLSSAMCVWRRAQSPGISAVYLTC